jgi:hypothetical protein
MQVLVELHPGQIWHSARLGLTLEILLCGGPSNQSRSVRCRTDGAEFWTDEEAFREWAREANATIWQMPEHYGSAARAIIPGLCLTSIWPQKDRSKPLPRCRGKDQE